MADFAGKVHATDCFNGNLSLPPSGGRRLGWGGFVSLNKIKFVCPVEPPSPQPSPTREGVDVGMEKVHPTLL